MDHCGNKGNFSDVVLYKNMSRALNATGRPILFSLCQWGEANVWEWGAEVGQMYRVQMDHLPFWNLPTTKSSGAGFGQGTKNIIEWMATLVPSKWVREYGYMDPDFLMTLFSQLPDTMGFINSRTEITFWSMWSAPLIVATDIRNLSAKKKELLTNTEVIAIDQDPSYTAGDRIRDDKNGGQLWARNLENKDKAIILYNSGETDTITVVVHWDEIGWPSDAVVKIRDLWGKQNIGLYGSSFNATLRPHDVFYGRLSLT